MGIQKISIVKYEENDIVISSKIRNRCRKESEEKHRNERK